MLPSMPLHALGPSGRPFGLDATPAAPEAPADPALQGEGFTWGSGSAAPTPARVVFFYAWVDCIEDPTTGRGERRMILHRMHAIDMKTAVAHPSSPEEAKRRWPRQWAEFNDSGAVATDGTPIYDLPLITKRMIGLAYMMHLHSIEDAAAAPDELLAQGGPEGMALRERARAWLAEKGQEEQVNALDRVAALELRMAQLAEANEELRRDRAAKDAALETLRATVARGGASPAAAHGQPATDKPVRVNDYDDDDGPDGAAFDNMLAAGPDMGDAEPIEVLE